MDSRWQGDGDGDLTERERLAPHWMKKLESLWSNGEGGLTFVPAKKGLPGEPYRLSAAQVSRWIDFLVCAVRYSLVVITILMYYLA